MVYPTTDTQRGSHAPTAFSAGATALVGASLLAAACTESKTDTSTEASTASANGALATTTAPTGSNEWALAYTGGTAGPANPSLEPIVVGYVNQEGGVPAFPEATAGTKAAVDYVNKELGGIGGHPLELKSCAVQAEEDGQRCGTEMVNDPQVRAVLTGVLTAGSDSLYKVVGAEAPRDRREPGLEPRLPRG